MCKKINLFLLTIFFVLFSLSTLVLAVDCPIPDTGQSKCYDATKEITCPSPGEDFYGQDAQYTCNPQSYTDLGNGIVRDNVTGLEWQQDTAHGTYTWQQAIDICDNLVLGAHSDWRLPTIMELSFITNLGNFDPSINTDYFPNTMSSYYWSSTTSAYDPGYAWVVSFGDGYVNGYYKSNYGNYVRAVRSGQCGSFGDLDDDCRIDCLDNCPSTPNGLG